MPSQAKQDYVSALFSRLEENPNFVLLNYNQLTHQQLEELRRSLRPLMTAHSGLSVVKNSLFRVALVKLNRKLKLFSEKELNKVVEHGLTGPSALLVLPPDWIGPLQAIRKFSSQHEGIEFKTGLIEGQVYKSTTLEKLSSLPSLEVLIGRIIGSMKAPQTRLVASMNYNTAKFIHVLKQGSKAKN